MRALPSISVDVILETYTPAEIDEKLIALKKELDDYYHSASGAGKSGSRDVNAVRSDMESFGQAKRILNCRGGVTTTQATFYTGPSANAGVIPGQPIYDSGAGI